LRDSRRRTYAPKQAPAVQAPAVYGRESVTDLNLSVWASVWAEVGDAISRLCVLPFLFGVLYGADQNVEKKQFNPFVPAYNLSEGGFAMAWSVGDSATVKVVVTLLCSPLVLSAAGGAVVGDTGISVLRVGTYLVTKASESWYR
jgi:hypothetical protein